MAVRDKRRGWTASEEGELTATIAAATSSDKHNHTVITGYQPPRLTPRFWLYRRWHSTVIQHVWPSVLLNVGTTLGLGCLLRATIGPTIGPFFGVPDPSHIVVKHLHPFYLMWTHHATLATFILTFFLGEAFSFWKRTLCHARVVQRTIADILLLVSTHARRDGAGRYTQPARELLDDTCKELKLLNILFWASVDNRFRSVASDRGLTKLTEMGIINAAQRDTLIWSNIPEKHRYPIVMQWVSTRLVMASERRDALWGGDFERTFDDLQRTLRDTCHMLRTDKPGRMPMAYMHIVHIMVDSLLLYGAAALYPKMGLVLSSCMVVLLTLFYRGLLELSKSFLDPFGNDGSRAQNIYVDVIIQEVNGALDRLIEGSLSLPKLRDDPTLPLELSSGRRVDNVPPVADGGEEDGLTGIKGLTMPLNGFSTEKAHNGHHNGHRNGHSKLQKPASAIS